MALLDYVSENGSLNIDEDPVTPGDIVYVSSLCTLAFFGTLGNIMILIMFSKKEFDRSSYSIYIRAAAVSDTIYMLMNISEDVIDHLTSYSTQKFFGTSHQFCTFWSVTNGTFLSASPWIVVALALDRCVAIWNPLHKTRYCTKKTAAIVTTCIVLASFGVELGLSLPFTTMVIGPAKFMICVDTGLSEEVLIIKRLVTETGLPCLTMLIPNLLVIFKIQKSLSFRRAFSATNGQQKKVAKSAQPLLVVSCLAFITLLPISITELVEFIKMNNAAVVDFPNRGNDYDDYPNPGNDYQFSANRNTSFNRTFDDNVFDFSNQTFENITTMRSYDEKEEAVSTDDVRHSLSDLIESTSLGTDDVRNSNSDLIESINLGTDDVGYSNSDLIESTNLGTGDDRNMNSDLIESTKNEDSDGQHDEMNSDDLENQQENGENQTSEKGHLGKLDDETHNLIDTIWKTCNFIYMCNFAQNFYLLILSSSTYRNAIIKMLICKCRKKKRDSPHVNRVIQQSVIQTTSTAETASTSLEAVNLNV